MGVPCTDAANNRRRTVSSDQLGMGASHQGKGDAISLLDPKDDLLGTTNDLKVHDSGLETPLLSALPHICPC